MLLDPWTLWLVVLFVGILLAGSMFFAWVLTPDEKALGYWGAFAGLLVGGVSGGMARGHIPDFVSIELANGAVLVAYGALWVGLRCFDRRPVRVVYLLAAPALWVLLCQLPLFRDSVGNRVVLVSLLIGVLVALALHQAWRGWVVPSRPRLAVFVLLLLVLVLNLARIPLAPTQVSGNQLVTFTDPSTAVTGIVALGVAMFMNFAFVLLVRERTEQLHRSAARSDELTGLLNRRGFVELAMRHCRDAGPIALMILDLDHFKQVNDHFGHAAGDRVLQIFAEVLRVNLRQADIVARIGGEEFAVLLPGAAEPAARQAAERVREAFRMVIGQVRFDDRPMTCSSSIGMVCGSFADTDGGTPRARLDALMTQADAALYAAKAMGRNRLEVTALPAAAEQRAVALGGRRGG